MEQTEFDPFSMSSSAILLSALSVLALSIIAYCCLLSLCLFCFVFIIVFYPENCSVYPVCTGVNRRNCS